ncbi:hypothetical protein EEL50_12685 [Muribaculaceae bacterium Isolate-105 (HZI)]|nr:hypothetical protein EEL50_12685 [Muribaculaceae bacterium Isolate-105 (HZI)]
MAKKNLASLMNGIMGDSKPMVSEVSSEERLEIPVSEVTEEMKDNLEAKRRQKVGRPRKGESGSKVEETRATFIVDPELIRKIKYISLVENNLLKDVISEALSSFIKSWEEENGKIRLPKKK